MAMLKVIEVLAESNKSWENAAQTALPPEGQKRVLIAVRPQAWDGTGRLPPQ